MRQIIKVLFAEDDPNLCRYLVKLMDDMNCEIGGSLCEYSRQHVTNPRFDL